MRADADPDRSSTPTTTTGRPATRSPATATRSSPTAAYGSSTSTASARYVFDGGRLHPIIPGPGDVHMRPRPGALYDYFAGKSDKARLGNELSCEDPAEHPEWFDRDARLRCMDEQGVEAAWLFPSQGVCMEGPMQPDIEASIDILRAFNRWLDEDWGFAYQNRIFAVPFLTLSDLDQAVDELEWCHRPRRPGHLDPQRSGVHARGHEVAGRSGFDPFWARVAEARRRRRAARRLRGRLRQGRRGGRRRVGSSGRAARRHDCHRPVLDRRQACS